MELNPGKLLSIIVPVYNEEKNILTLLSQFDRQSIHGFEVIIVDDGSTDKTVSLIDEYSPQHFTIILLRQKNMGAACAREHAIRFSRRLYIAFIDCDDGLAENALELAMQPLIQNSDVDISLFRLNYISELDGEITNQFKCFRDDKVIDGKDAFENCISYWGLHGFGIYSKGLILSAYDIYHKYNHEHVNYINNDEVISRVAFYLAGKISLSGGDYFFVNNMSSTTRRVNENYYKVIYNTFILNDIINDVFLDCKKNINEKLAELIISTVWGTFVRYIKWRNLLSKEAKILWRDNLKTACKSITIKCNKNSLNRKSQLQFFILKSYFRWL
ncbi:glycosyltransferase family 2 protein [Cedecea neteri]|uniref:glycosyltransferase family 2 protein n=1 Tax=Cedecea neteri TaxID=158822 RepID=UPI002AA71B1E|nr:glycosyltransferase family 2 protein [Cedecea neteri]WPU25550.1 glycosyltransferase family 2 protein [Cedecea neteri]